MPEKTESNFQILDNRQQQVGEITIERSEDNLVYGKFIPGPAFAEVEHLFRQFEEAVNSQALRKVDELDAAIGALGLHLCSPDGSQRLAIKDVQIWSDGSITCRLVGTTLAEVNGSLVSTPRQPARK
jgi:hypothetical protein